MKKHIFLFAIAVLSCLNMMGDEPPKYNPGITTEMNPFAYNAYAELSDDQQTVTIRYSLNADARTVTIKFYDGENLVDTYTCEGDLLKKTTSSDPYIAAHQHKVGIPTTNFGVGKDITWRIEVTGEGRATYEKYSQDGKNIYRHKFYRPSSVDIVQDPTSFNYGKVLVVESQHEASTTKGLHSYQRVKTKGDGKGNTDPQGAGIYVFNPDLTPRENTSGTYVFNGKNDSRFVGTEYAPYRVRISEDGRMFVSSLYTNGDILWEIDPYFSSWTTVIGKGLSGTTWRGKISSSGEEDTDYRLNTTNGYFIAAPNAGLDVRGKGGDLKLLLLSCTGKAMGMGTAGFHTCEYHLGEAKTWNQVPTKDFQTNHTTTKDATTGKMKSVFIHKNTSNVQYDQEGGIWCISYRAKCSDTLPGLVHKDANGIENSRILRSGTKNAGLRFKKDFSQAIMATTGGWGTHYDYDPTHIENQSGERGYFINERNINMAEVGDYINDFAWDNANNIFVVGHHGTNQTGGEGYVAVYCLPYNSEDIFTTPGRNTFQLKDRIIWHPYPEEKPITNADLKIAFDEDFAQWNNNSIMDFMTNANSPWKWLGDYIAKKTKPNFEVPTNEELWGKDTADISGLMHYFNHYHSIKRASQAIGNASAFLANSSNTYTILTNVNSKYKWLGDYILELANSQDISISSSYSYWHWVLHGFFNKDNKKSSNSGGNSWTHNIDFSEAGEPENWGPAYIAAHGGIVLNSDATWQTQVNDFFNQTGKFTLAGQPNATGWYNQWWAATFPGEMKEGDKMPNIKKEGHVLGGWYYGNETTYDIDQKISTSYVPRQDHVWARWLETCLYEGYCKPATAANGASQQEIAAGQANRNAELVEVLNGTEIALSIDRKLQGGIYNTFVLPFALTSKNDLNNFVQKSNQTVSLLPASTTSIRYYTGSEIVPNGEGEYVLQLNFTEWDGSTTIAANTPFLIQPANNITEQMIIKWSPEISNTQNTIEDTYVIFTPVLAPTEVQGGAGTNNFILVADNRLARLSSTGTMLGLRGYFNGSEIPDDLTPQKMIVKITEKNGVVTYLDNIESPQQGAAAIKIMQNGTIYILRDGKVYDVMGRPLREL